MIQPSEILSSVVAVLIVGLVGWIIKKWLTDLKESMKEAIQSILKSVDDLRKEITRLFQRSEEDRLERARCQLDAQRTYATNKRVDNLEKRIMDIERQENQ